VGLITYMRTDSVRISPDAQKEAMAYIAEKYGRDFVPDRPNVYKNKKSVQDAHEGIRPTSIWRDPASVKKFLSKDQHRLYTLIWERFLASQMKAAVLDQTIVDIAAGSYLLRATGSVVTFPGFMVLYVEGTDEEKNGDNGEGESASGKGRGGDEKKLLPHLEKGEVLDLRKITSKQHFTKPPPRYTEATLVKELEEKGIGRPSTYAAILSNIMDRHYVGKERRVLFPTELGYIINDLLVASFPDIMDAAFTAQMEERLDGIEEGKASSTDILSEFYGPFSKEVERAANEMQNSIPTDVMCEKCGRPMAIKWGKNGSFLACTGYPECKNTKDYDRDEKGRIQVVGQETTEEKCPKCSSPMVVKKGKFGPFLACTAYPKCKTTMPLTPEGEAVRKNEGEPTDEVCSKCGGNMVIRTSRNGNRFLACDNYPKCKNARPLGIGVACPVEGCGGEVTERTSKKGRKFYGCTRYPDCKYVSWYKPVHRPCPVCGSNYLLEKDTKKDGPHLACPTKGCSYKEPVKSD
jgi:DNA topoisomerase I